MRIELVAVATLCLASPANALSQVAEAPAVNAASLPLTYLPAEGQRVRITYATEEEALMTTTGFFRGASKDSLRLTSRSGVTQLPLVNAVRLEVSQGKNREKGAAIGALVGGLSGALLGSVIVKDGCMGCNNPGMLGAMVYGTIGLGAGTLAGAVIGFERWEERWVGETLRCVRQTPRERRMVVCGVR